MTAPFLCACALILARLAPAPHGVPSAPTGDAIDAVIESAMAQDGLPGLSLVVGRAGAIVKEAAYGLASVELGVPATLDTVYPLASATKTMSSTAVLLLVGEGRFTLEDSIVELLPDLPEAWLEVTVGHLLTHTSGLPDVTLDTGREPLIASTYEEALPKLRDMPCVPPGTRWSYCQTNYVLLKQLVEHASGQTFDEYLQARLFRPLELASFRFGDADDVVPGRASMYDRRGGILHPRQSRFPPYVRAAAGLNASVRDWYRWADAWAHGRILGPELLARQWEPARLASGTAVNLGGTASYGCGVALDTRVGRRAVGHSGGGNAVLDYLVDEDVLIVLATNGTTDVDALAARVAAALREMPVK